MMEVKRRLSGAHGTRLNLRSGMMLQDDEEDTKGHIRKNGKNKNKAPLILQIHCIKTSLDILKSLYKHFFTVRRENANKVTRDC